MLRIDNYTSTAPRALARIPYGQKNRVRMELEALVTHVGTYICPTAIFIFKGDADIAKECKPLNW